MKSLKDTFTLNNSVKMPCVGFGTWQTEDGEVAISSVVNAIDAGYIHIDTAAVYGNEVSVGEGIRKSGIKREDLFVTSKLWNSERGYEKTIKAFNRTLTDLGLDYLDLYLIHWPANSKQFENYNEINLDTWRAFEDLYKQGKIKAIGVSNFLPMHLEVIMQNCVVKPAVNQIEYHIGFMQKETVEYCKKHDILVVGWSPLGTGDLLKNVRLGEIAKKYNVSTAQLAIRWCLQHNVLPLPKSVHKERILQNTKVFDFEISSQDMKELDAFDFIGGQGKDPDSITF